MIIFKTILSLQNYLGKQKRTGKSIGFVPTMGALHTGHLSLIQQSQMACNVSVASIFVNPTQFNDPKDFEKYPVTLNKDCLKLEQQQTDVLFLPSINEIYPHGIALQQAFDLGNLENIFEGHYRPGHYKGVCQVVSRLLNIVQPDQLFLGQKDYQQCKVISRLVQLMGINTQINIASTLREPDGLAMSSRNVRLNTEQRQQSTAIYRQLEMIKENVALLSIEQLVQQATASLLQAGFSKVDYVAIANADNLQPLTAITQNQNAIALIAAFMGDIRLIDNLMLT